jgi:uncharacterized C2H2 Zn-finger protein
MRQIEIIDGEEFLDCKTCGKLKDIKEFNRDRSNVVGYARYCKVCYSQKIKEHQKGEGYDPKNVALAMELLEKMDYDITQDIHQQFIKKHPEIFGGEK